MSWLELFGASLSVSIAVTGVFMGGCAFMTGRSLALAWQPWWQAVPYIALLAVADRFLIYALFGGRLSSLTGLVLDWLFLLAVATLAYLAARAHLMVRQYPWLFERLGPFAWRRKRGP